MALLSALFAASRRVSEKRLLAEIHHFNLGWIIQLCSLPIITAAMLLAGQWINPLTLGASFWWPLVLVCLGFYPLNTYLVFQAIKHDELSNVLPIGSLWSVLTLVPAWLLLGETPSWLGVAGIITIILGVYALGLKGKRLHRPWQPFLDNRSSRYGLMSVVLLTIVSLLDKVAIEASNALFFSFASSLGAVTVLYGLSVTNGSNQRTMLWSKMKQISLLGTLQGASYTTYLLALSLGPIAYVTAIRSSTGLLGSLLGILILKEAFTANKKLSFALIAIGSVLLAVGS